MSQENTKKNPVSFGEMSVKDFTGGESPAKSKENPDNFPGVDFDESLPEEDFADFGADFGEDFGGDFAEDLEEFEDFDTPPLHERQPIGREERAKTSAKSLTSMLDLGMSFGASMYSKRDRSAYKMTSTERQDIEQAAYEWLLTVEVDISPGLAFVTTVLMVSAPTVIAAREHRQQYDKEQEYKRLRAEADRVEAERMKSEPAAPRSEARIEALKSRPKIGRKQFQVDKDGLYIKSETGKDLRKIDRKEKAPPEILEIIKDCELREFSIGKTNEECRKYMYT